MGVPVVTKLGNGMNKRAIGPRAASKINIRSRNTPDLKRSCQIMISGRFS